MKKYLFILLVIVSTSCSDFLKEYSQDKSYVTGYQDLDELLLGEAYMNRHELAGYQFDGGEVAYYPYVHFMADETEQCLSGSWYAATGAAYTLYGYYTWQPLVTKNPEGGDSWDDGGDWKKLYKHINVLNVILSTVKDLGADADTTLENRVKGETLFLRAAYYFALTNVYGQPYDPLTADEALAVPLKSTPYVEDIHFRRSTVAKAYEYILKDLLESEDLMKDIEKESVYRVDITGVRLMLSRVYLYMQDFTNAKLYAQKVLDANGSLQDLNTMLGEEFLNPSSPELIFSMGSASLHTNIATNSYDVQINQFQVSEDLYNAYEEGDLRTQYYVVKDGQIIYYNKMNGEYQGTTELSDNFVFRTSEAYLNLAESAAMLKDQNTAKKALNALRSNRFESDKFDASVVNNLSQDQLVYFIRDERRRELCLEGHRWFDLRRYNVVSEYPNTKTLTASYTYFEDPDNDYIYTPSSTENFTLEPNDNSYTLPIPQYELDYNSDMVGNER